MFVNAENIINEFNQWAESLKIDPIKVAIYIRWSTDDQGDGTTLDVQLEGCKYYILSQGWQVSENLIFIDDGYSGGNLERPAMTRMRKAIKENKINCIVVFKLDRLSRSVKDTVDLVMGEWQGMAHVKSAREPVDTTTPMGRQFFYMLSSYAEWERSVIHERTFSGKVKRAREGRNPGFKPPYGYRTGKLPGQFEIVPTEAEIVKKIYRDYIGSAGSSSITYTLNELGVPFRKGKIWNVSTVMHILSNPFYTGRIAFGRLTRNVNRKRDGGNFWIRNEAPLSVVKSDEITPLISDDDFNAVQQLRIAHHAVPSRSVSSPFLLSGLLRCGKCGHHLVGWNQGSKSETWAHYYRCHGKRSKGSAFCNSGSIRQDDLDRNVVEDVKKTFLNEDGRNKVEDMLHNQYNNQIAELEAAVSLADNEIADLNRQMARLDRDYRSGHLDAPVYSRLLTEIQTERAGLAHSTDKNKEEIEEKKRQIISPEAVMEFAYQLRDWDKLTVIQQRNVLRVWIDHIDVYRRAGDKGVPDVTVYYRHQLNTAG